MNKTAAAGIAGFLLAMTPVIASTNAFTTDPQAEIKSPKRYIVLFKNPSINSKDSSQAKISAAFSAAFSADRADNLISTLGGQVTRALPSIAGIVAHLTPTQLEQLQNNPEVALVEEDPLRTFQAESQPYGLSQIQADQLSDANTGNIKICIADTGIDINHEDLPSPANITGEVSNTLTEPTDIGTWDEDSNGHGTKMAGTIAAIGGNNIGIAGVNPGGHINLHVVKIIDNPSLWPFYGSDVIAAVERCQAAGANIINLSLAGDKHSAAEEQAIQTAYDAGILLVGASGNRGSAAYKYPAAYNSVISAAATDEQEAVSISSHFNDQIELSAPGVNIESTAPNNRYTFSDSASFATAYIAGAAGLIWSHHPDCTNGQIREILQQSAKDLGDAGRDDHYGYGLIQAKDALDLIDLNGCDNITNTAPELSGTPPISVNENRQYLFTPTATDAEGDSLTYSIANEPSWLTVDPFSGQVIGTPGGTGAAVLTDIVLTVSDDTLTDSLTFSITVVPSVYSEWENDGAPTDHSGWTPVADSQIVDFIQSQDVKQKQTRTEQQQALDINGLVIDVDAPITHNQQIDDSESRTVNVIADVWQNSGEVSACSVWSPATDTVDYGTAFEQSRDCQQSQTQDWSYLADGVSIHSRIESQTIPVNESQTATGSKQNWIPYPSSYTKWADEGDRYNYSTWLPVAGSQTALFTQSSTYMQYQTREQQPRERDTISNLIRDVGEPIPEGQIIDGPEARVVTVTWANWADSGAAHNCDNWSPTANTIGYNVAFTQNRSCQQDQIGERLYTVNSNTIINTQPDIRTINTAQSQAATGVGNWSHYPSLFTEWTNVGPRYDYTEWLPLIDTQTVNFIQSSSYNQLQTQDEQPREYDTISGAIRDTGAVITHPQTINDIEDRTVAVSSANWTNNGSHFACGSWSPSTDTYRAGNSYTQYRWCQQNQTGDRLYKVDGTLMDTQATSRVISASESRQATGTGDENAPLPVDWAVMIPIINLVLFN